TELSVAPTKAIQKLRTEILDDLTADEAPISAQAKRWLVGADVVPRQLPADIKGFVGRADALSRLDRLASNQDDTGAHESVDVVVITGPAGVGKSALAIHWAHRFAGRLPCAQLYIDMKGFSSGYPLHPHDALEDLLLCLNIPMNQVCATPHARVSQYRSALAERQVLLVV